MRYYFAYGSNIKKDRLEGRLDKVKVFGVAILKGYHIAFNKQSVDRTGKANIIPMVQEEIFGVLYGLSEDQFKKLDKNEDGYKRVSMNVYLGIKKINAQTYIALEEKVNDNLFPTEKYLNFLIEGAREHNFPEEYQNFLKNFIICK